MRLIVNVDNVKGLCFKSGKPKSKATTYCEINILDGNGTVVIKERTETASKTANPGYSYLEDLTSKVESHEAWLSLSKARLSIYQIIKKKPKLIGAVEVNLLDNEVASNVDNIDDVKTESANLYMPDKGEDVQGVMEYRILFSADRIKTDNDNKQDSETTENSYNQKADQDPQRELIRDASLMIQVQSCTELLDMDRNGESDAYVVMSLLNANGERVHRVKSDVISNNKNPEFVDFSHHFVGKETTEFKVEDVATVQLSVFDQDKKSNDDLIGSIEFDLASIDTELDDRTKRIRAFVLHLDSNNNGFIERLEIVNLLVALCGDMTRAEEQADSLPQNVSLASVVDLLCSRYGRAWSADGCVFYSNSFHGRKWLEMEKEANRIVQVEETDRAKRITHVVQTLDDNGNGFIERSEVVRLMMVFYNGDKAAAEQQAYRYPRESSLEQVEILLSSVYGSAWNKTGDVFNEDSDMAAKWLQMEDAIKDMDKHDEKKKKEKKQKDGDDDEPATTDRDKRILALVRDLDSNDDGLVDRPEVIKFLTKLIGDPALAEAQAEKLPIEASHKDVIDLMNQRYGTAWDEDGQVFYPNSKLGMAFLDMEWAAEMIVDDRFQAHMKSYNLKHADAKNDGDRGKINMAIIYESAIYTDSPAQEGAKAANQEEKKEEEEEEAEANAGDTAEIREKEEKEEKEKEDTQASEQERSVETAELGTVSILVKSCKDLPQMDKGKTNLTDAFLKLVLVDNDDKLVDPTEGWSCAHVPNSLNPEFDHEFVVPSEVLTSLLENNKNEKKNEKSNTNKTGDNEKKKNNKNDDQAAAPLKLSGSAKVMVYDKDKKRDQLIGSVMLNLQSLVDAAYHNDTVSSSSSTSSDDKDTRVFTDLPIIFEQEKEKGDKTVERGSITLSAVYRIPSQDETLAKEEKEPDKKESTQEKEEEKEEKTEPALTITLKQATGLMNLDRGRNVSDVYVKISVLDSSVDEIDDINKHANNNIDNEDGYQKAMKQILNTKPLCQPAQTKVYVNELNPDFEGWNHTFNLSDIPDWEQARKVRVSVWDKDKGDDDLIGLVHVDLWQKEGAGFELEREHVELLLPGQTPRQEEDEQEKAPEEAEKEKSANADAQEQKEEEDKDKEKQDEEKSNGKEEEKTSEGEEGEEGEEKNPEPNSRGRISFKVHLWDNILLDLEEVERRRIARIQEEKRIEEEVQRRLKQLQEEERLRKIREAEEQKRQEEEARRIQEEEDERRRQELIDANPPKTPLTPKSALADLIDRAVDATVNNVCTGISLGAIKPKENRAAWDIKSELDEKTRTRILKQRRYDRVTRLLQIEKGRGIKHSAQELLKLNEELEVDLTLIGSGTIADIISGDMQEMLKVKENRRRAQLFRKREAERRQRLKEKKLKQISQAESHELKKEEYKKMMEAKLQAYRDQKKLEFAEKHRRREEEKKREAELVKAAQAHVRARKHRTPLYKKMKEQYERNVVMPELEARKKRLAELRKKVEPLDVQALREHDRKYREMMEAKHRKNYEENRAAVLARNQEVNFYQPRFVRRLKAEDEKKRKEAEAKLEARKNRAKLQRQYAALVQDMFKPKVDPAKQLELANRRAKFKKRALKVDNEVILQAKREANAAIRFRPPTDQSRGEQVLIESRRRARLERLRQRQEEERRKEEEAARGKHTVDYLAEMRAKRKAAGDKPRRVKLSPQELEQHARVLEAKALKKEVRLQRKLQAASPSSDAGGHASPARNSSSHDGDNQTLNFSSASIEEAADISDMYIDIIKTKMRLLQSDE